MISTTLGTLRDVRRELGDIGNVLERMTEEMAGLRGSVDQLTTDRQEPDTRTAELEKRIEKLERQVQKLKKRRERGS